MSGTISNNGSSSGTISGGLLGSSGPFQNAAGLYSGTIRGCTGRVQAILSADGILFFYALDDSAGPDGGRAMIVGNSFTVATPRGAHYAGTLNAAARTLSGTVDHDPCGLSGPISFVMTRSEKLF